MHTDQHCTDLAYYVFDLCTRLKTIRFSLVDK